jgi:hypothetical protein
MIGSIIMEQALAAWSTRQGRRCGRRGGAERAEVFGQVALVPGDIQVFCASPAPRRLSEDPAELRRSPGGRILHKRVTQLGISSSEIRALIANRRSPRYLVPDPVLEIIEREGLYLGPAGRPNIFPIPDAPRPAQPQAEEILCSLNN